ncbi:hypothetical protein BKA62DRAFT_53122 [Auriculariales sp. MPI-PUGE-AT-0066]|nr:hypothetical protein BKA62DRAFT_53122 [Auriculariales sp. MPI-PUGE-AT-0066]
MKVKTFHKSFADFLIDPRRCSDERFRILRDREEPRLALATVQATRILPHVEDESEIATHMGKYWCSHLLNTLRNPNLDSTRVLSAIRTFLPAEQVYRLLCPMLTVENLTNIQFLLAVLVNKCPNLCSQSFSRISLLSPGRGGRKARMVIGGR